MALEVRDDAARSRYDLLDDGQVVGFTEYRTDPRPSHPGALLFLHTVVAAPRRGAGFGSVLVRGALDDVRRKGATVVPACHFVAKFIAEHPEYADLVAA